MCERYDEEMRNQRKLRLSILPMELAVWKLPPNAALPPFGAAEFWSVTRTGEELSVVSGPALVPTGVPSEGGWRCLGVKGPLAFEMVGVMAALSVPLGEAGISIFVLSTFDTDYLLVKGRQFELACEVLRRAGHEIVDQG